MAECEITGYRFAAKVQYRTEADLAENRTTVHITGLEMRSLWTAPVGGCWITGSIYVAGTRAVQMIVNNTQFCGISMTGSYSGGGEGSWSGFSSTDVVLEHAPDGSRTEVPIRVELLVLATNGTALAPGLSGTANVDLPRIPRVTGISAQGTLLGQPVQITLQRASGEFRDTVTWHCGSRSGMIADHTAQTALTFTPEIGLAEQAPDSDRAAVTIRVETRLGDTLIGSGEYTVYCALPAELVPTLEVTLSDGMGYDALHGGYIQNRSRLRVQTAAAGCLGSTPAEISVTCGSMKAKGEDLLFSLPDSGSVSVAVTVKDSRGRKATSRKKITVLAYSDPRVTIRAVSRCNETGEIAPDGSWAKILFDAEVTPVRGGTAEYTVLWSPHSGRSITQTPLPDYRDRFSLQGAEAILPAGQDSSYDCVIRVRDSFCTVESSQCLIPTAFVLLDFDRDNRAVGIGVRAKQAGKLCIGLNADMGEHRIGNLAEPESAGDAATKAYVDSQIQTLAEALGAAV